jgi:hypothetical protein
MADQEHAHPPYILIWVVLLVLTLAEVAMSLYMTNVSKVVLAVGLILMAIWKAVLVAMGYFQNHRHMMDYKRYLACGYPVSTGLVEGCCGHLVKDRMEGSGMRWSRAGAQHVLDIRAVDKNGDWEDFSRFVKEQGQPPILKHAA